MAEQAPSAEQAAMQEKFQEMIKQIGPLVEILQGDASPKEKLQAAKKLSQILEQLKKMLPPEQYQEQFGQLEMFVGQVLGSLEG